jgi:hypothetical protein
LTDDGDAQNVLAGEKARSGRAGGPPIRPPPPRTASPAQGGLRPSQPKSAFDDLDDSIREAFGGSPSRSFGGGAGSMGQPQPVAGVFGSSSHQHAFAPNTEMFSSPVRGVANVDSVAAIGGGSL